MKLCFMLFTLLKLNWASFPKMIGEPKSDENRSDTKRRPGQLVGRIAGPATLHGLRNLQPKTFTSGEPPTLMSLAAVHFPVCGNLAIGHGFGHTHDVVGEHWHQSASIIIHQGLGLCVK